MRNFLKNFTGQLILGGIITVLTIFSFSLYFFVNINDISVVGTDTAKTIQDVPGILFIIQSSLLHETNLLSSFHHNFISSDAFLVQLEEINKQESVQLEKIRKLQDQFKDVTFINKEEEVFSRQFEHTLNTISAILNDVEEKMKLMVSVHEAKDEMREKQIRNEIVGLENKLENEMSSLDGMVNVLLDQRNRYINDIVASILKNSFFFMSFMLILIIGLNTYLILQMVFSLRGILKGIEASKQGNLAYRITLHTDNEFSVIAKSFNEAAGIIEEKETALRQTMEEMKNQARDLAEKNDHLEQFQKITVGRELKMIELKKEIAALKGEPRSNIEREELKKNHAS